MAVSSRIIIRTVGNITVIGFVDSAITDMQQIQQITKEINTVIQDKDRKAIVLDFSTVKFLSSQTLGMLLQFHKRLSANSGWFGLCGLKKELYKVFKLTRLDQLFRFYATEEEAVDDAMMQINLNKI